MCWVFLMPYNCKVKGQGAFCSLSCYCKENLYFSQKHSWATKLNILLLIIEHLLQDVLQAPEGQHV